MTDDDGVDFETDLCFGTVSNDIDIRLIEMLLYNYIATTKPKFARGSKFCGRPQKRPKPRERHTEEGHQRKKVVVW